LNVGCEKTLDQFNVIRKLLGRADVTTIVNAADAGREGELIFDLVYTLARCRKPREALARGQHQKLLWSM
jgi:DNA topoisomerase IA